jgi:hypothetical protein
MNRSLQHLFYLFSAKNKPGEKSPGQLVEKAASNLKNEKLDKKCEKKQYIHLCSTYFLRFMAANLSLTQLMTRV